MLIVRDLSMTLYEDMAGQFNHGLQRMIKMNQDFFWQREDNKNKKSVQMPQKPEIDGFV